jgi:hypothetical protein
MTYSVDLRARAVKICVTVLAALIILIDRVNVNAYLLMHPRILQ